MYWFFISLIPWQDIFICYMILYVRIFLWDLCLTCAPVSHEILIHMQPFPGNSNFQMKSYFAVSETCHFMPAADSFHGVSMIYVVRSASYKVILQFLRHVILCLRLTAFMVSQWFMWSDPPHTRKCVQALTFILLWCWFPTTKSISYIHNGNPTTGKKVFLY